ncbi:MAG: hypothetical protein BHW64_03360 [Candidatus Melainabacteria bacterium LEY3_CP_29_8]|nr:MAG: hypothetical protein BHW64_03360 [Candidatus Melainabacteria bacterium LEY3_CP_29_8]
MTSEYNNEKYKNADENTKKCSAFVDTIDNITKSEFSAQEKRDLRATLDDIVCTDNIYGRIQYTFGLPLLKRLKEHFQTRDNYTEMIDQAIVEAEKKEQEAKNQQLQEMAKQLKNTSIQITSDNFLEQISCRIDVSNDDCRKWLANNPIKLQDTLLNSIITAAVPPKKWKKTTYEQNFWTNLDEDSLNGLKCLQYLIEQEFPKSTGERKVLLKSAKAKLDAKIMDIEIEIELLKNAALVQKICEKYEGSTANGSLYSFININSGESINFSPYWQTKGLMNAMRDQCAETGKKFDKEKYRKAVDDAKTNLTSEKRAQNLVSVINTMLLDIPEPEDGTSGNIKIDLVTQNTFEKLFNWINSTRQAEFEEMIQNCVTKRTNSSNSVAQTGGSIKIGSEAACANFDLFMAIYLIKKYGNGIFNSDYNMNTIKNQHERDFINYMATNTLTFGITKKAEAIANYIS